MTQELIERAVNKFADETKSAYGDKLNQIILFGSCARGDYDNESDIDVMVLLNVPAGDIEHERSRIADISSQVDSDLDYDVLMAPVVQSSVVFSKYKNVMPFYINIQKEGVVYAR